jgi:Helix-turn-helix
VYLSSRHPGSPLEISKIERGKTAPSLEMLILLSDRFHQSADWMGNLIARWTSWSVSSDSAGVKQCHLRSTSIWEGGDRFFAKQSQEVLCFHGQRYGEAISTGGGASQDTPRKSRREQPKLGKKPGRTTFETKSNLLRFL